MSNRIDDFLSLAEEIEDLRSDLDHERLKARSLESLAQRLHEVWAQEPLPEGHSVNLGQLLQVISRELPGLRASQERRRELELEKDPDWQP